MATAYEWLKLTGTPPKVVWLKCPPPEIDFLSPDECELLLSGATGMLFEMILTALRTGMRQGELLGLQWQSINWESRNILVRHSRCYYTNNLVTPKNNRYRMVPMDKDVFELLWKRKRETGYVFVDDRGRPFGSRRHLNDLKRIARALGLRSIGWHALRHTFATHLTSKGIPMSDVKTLLGHSSIKTTERYSHVAPTALRYAIDMLNPRTAISAVFGQPVGNQWIEAQPVNARKS